MKNNQSQYRISYIKLFKILRNEGYSIKETIITILDIRKMESEVCNAYLHWLYTSEYPKDFLNGVNVERLSDIYSITPTAAFLMADYMKKDPDKAQSLISTSCKDEKTPVYCEEYPEDLSELIAQIEEYAKLTEDTSDIVSTNNYSREGNNG